VASAAVGSIFLTTARRTWAAVSAAGPADLADGILLVVALLGASLSLWLGLGMTLSALSAVPGALGQVCEQLAGQVAPAAVRKVVAFILGTTLTAAFVPGTAFAGIGHVPLRPAVVAAARHLMSDLSMRDLAEAAPAASFRDESRAPRSIRATDAAPSPLWSTEGPMSNERPGSMARPSSPHEPLLNREHIPAGSVVVHRGDTLWSISARQLGAAATTADIDAQWRSWFAANRDVIGADANLILPGQVLDAPPPPRPTS